MGCSASKPKTLSSKAPDEPSSSSHSVFSLQSSPVPRALSLPSPLIHHPPLRKGDTNHLVCLTSTTYGSLLLIDPKLNPSFKGSDFSDLNPTNGVIAANQSADSLSPDSVINTWELMDGLDEFDIDSGESSLKLDSSVSCSNYLDCDKPVKNRSNSLELVKKLELEKECNHNTKPVSKPLWKHLSEESLLSKMDPNVVSSYMRALSSSNLGSNLSTPSKCIRTAPATPLNSGRCSGWSLPGTDDKVVLYVTSLRGIRKTYEDCCTIQMIFRGFRVPVDGRDISMDSAYRKELQNVLGGKAVALPQVFIRGKYIGGAEEIKQLNETGQLEKLLEGLPVRDSWFVCDSCGDARFVPCPECCGSRKVFEEEKGQLRMCFVCNENGLIRCPGCCL